MKKKKKYLVLYFKQHILKCEKNNCVWHVYGFFFFLSDNFLTSTIILLIFIRGVPVREKGGKKRE